jgi:hypothetical protein
MQSVILGPLPADICQPVSRRPFRAVTPLKDAEGIELPTQLLSGRRKTFPKAAAAGKAIIEQTAKEGRD